MIEIRLSDYWASIRAVFGNGLSNNDLQRFIREQAERLHDDCANTYNNKKRLLPVYRKVMILALDYY